MHTDEVTTSSRNDGNTVLPAALFSNEQGNELIGEFMGLHFHKTGWVDNCHIDGNYECDELKYNYSWDWLMPVVEKIQSIDITPPPRYTGYRIEIVVQGYVMIKGFPMPTINTNVSIEGSLIKAVWLAVVKFIMWHKEQSVSTR